MNSGRSACQGQMAGAGCQGAGFSALTYGSSLCLGRAPGSDVAETCLSWPAPSKLFTKKKREAEGRSSSRDGNESRLGPFNSPDSTSPVCRGPTGGTRGLACFPAVCGLVAHHHPMGPCEGSEPSLGLEQQDACSPRSAQVTVLR